jgi:FkbM family methyltransferase
MMKLAYRGLWGKIRPLTDHARQEREEIARLLKMPFQNGTTDLLPGPCLHFVDGPSTVSQFHDVWTNEVYRFNTQREYPLILDCGSNVGMSTIYWKHLYPHARIVAFEPDQTVFTIFITNLSAWHITDVQAVNAAVWTHDGDVPFWTEGSDAGRLLWRAEDGSTSGQLVHTVRLRDYLTEPIELLKLDIEGAELPVLTDCRDRLHQVERLFVEYHSMIGRPQLLDDLISVIRAAGYRLYAQTQILIRSPFITRLRHKGMDQTINIFAWREKTE